MRRLLAVGAIVGAAVLALPVPADAKTIERGHFDDHEVIDFDDFCGDLVVRLEVHDTGTYSARLGGPGQLPRFASTHHGGATWTNVATGRSFTAWWNYSNKDIKVTDNGDGTLTVLYQVPGPERIYGVDGQQLNISTGMMRLAALIDHNGTPRDPSDDTFLSEELVSDHGYPPQPPFDFFAEFHRQTAA
jgi:hypothetical protein